MTLTIKLDGNWSSFQLANSAPPLSVTDSAIAPSARKAVEEREGGKDELHWLTFAWLCLALDRHWNFVGRYFFLAELFHAFDLN